VVRLYSGGLDGFSFYAEPAMTEHPLLPLLGDPPRERSDAARNREALLVAAQEIATTCGYDAVTMDAVAARAGVGKGTVFRRFQSREGLMGALLDASESAWQDSVMRGEPPLGPGAPPMDRLLAFGRSRLEIVLQHADLIRNAGFGGATRSFAAYSFAATHVRYLLGELGVRGDVALLAVALLAPLELPILDQQVRLEQIDVDRIHAGWADLAYRITGFPSGGA
jgi:AcrR family transcriptional regulator